MSAIQGSARSPVCWLLALLLSLSFGCASGTGPARKADQNKQNREAVARYNLGVHHLSAGRTALAIRELLVAVEKNPNDPWIRLALAEGYRRKANVEDAERHLLRSLEVRPAFQQATLSLSALYVQVGRYEDALVYSQKLVDDPTYPAPWQAHTNLGWALFKLGRNAEARSNLELAIEYRPYFWRAILNLAVLEAQEGHRVEAIRHFQKVLDLKPGALARAEVNYLLAEVYVSLGRRDAALEHLAEVAGLRPNGAWGRRSEEYLKLLR